MENELQKINEYAKMGANLPKVEFIILFKKIVRKGTNEEIKQVFQIIKNLESIPELENFCFNAKNTYTKIQKSSLNYYRFKKSIKECQNQKADSYLINFYYSKIQDPYFLEQANKLISQYPNIANLIVLRKTKKEMEEEKENLKNELNHFLKRLSNLFNNLNIYISSRVYTQEKNYDFIKIIEQLQSSVAKFSDVLGDVEYKNILKEIEGAKDYLNIIVNGLEEEEMALAR